jgi:hypothetical protein
MRPPKGEDIWLHYARTSAGTYATVTGTLPYRSLSISSSNREHIHTVGRRLNSIEPRCLVPIAIISSGYRCDTPSVRKTLVEHGGPEGNFVVVDLKLRS